MMVRVCAREIDFTSRRYFEFVATKDDLGATPQDSTKSYAGRLETNTSTPHMSHL